jgi:hypothetical protein
MSSTILLSYMPMKYFDHTHPPSPSPTLLFPSPTVLVLHSRHLFTCLLIHRSRLHMKENMHYLSFSVWHISFNMIIFTPFIFLQMT